MQSGSKSAAITPHDPEPVGAGTELTELEQRVLDYMVGHLRERTYQPSIREIGRHFEIKSTKTVSELLQSLADKGVIERNPSRSRGVRIVSLDLRASAVSLPCFGSLREALDSRFCGDGEGRIALDRQLVGGSEGFLVRAPASRLAAVGIEGGDLLLVRPTRLEDLIDGEVVVAVVGGGVDFHRIESSGARVALRALWGEGENGASLGPGDRVVVGRVSAVYRRLVSPPLAVPAVAH